MKATLPQRLIDSTLSSSPDWLHQDLIWEWLEALSALGVGTVEVGTIRGPQEWRQAEALLATARRRTGAPRLQFSLEPSCGAHPLLARADVSWRLEVDFEASPRAVDDTLALARLIAAPTLAVRGSGDADPVALHGRVERCRAAGCRTVELMSREGRPWTAGVQALLEFVRPFEGMTWIWSSQNSGGLALAQALTALECGVQGVRGNVGSGAEVPLQLLLRRAGAPPGALAELSDWVFEQFGVEADSITLDADGGGETPPATHSLSVFSTPADVARWLASRELPSDAASVDKVLSRARSSGAALGELEVVDLLLSSS